MSRDSGLASDKAKCQAQGHVQLETLCPELESREQCLTHFGEFPQQLWTRQEKKKKEPKMSPPSSSSLKTDFKARMSDCELDFYQLTC